MLDRIENEVDLQERHFQVFREVAESQPIGIVALSTKLPYSNHQIRYSLRKLEEEDVIEPTSNGAVTTNAAKAATDEYQERLEAVRQQFQALKRDYGHDN